MLMWLGFEFEFDACGLMIKVMTKMIMINNGDY